MDERLTEDQGMLREAATRLCRDFGGAKRARQLRDGGQDFDAEAWAAMRDSGWLGILLPEDRGGAAMGAIGLYLLSEQIGRQTLMVPMAESAAVAWALGRATGAAAQSGIDAVLAGRLVMPAIAGDGWDFRREALPFAAFAQSAEQFLVRADQSGETLLCLVPRQSNGCALTLSRNVDGSSAGRLTIDPAAIGAAQMVARGPEAEALSAGMADLLALGAAIELQGLAESALAMTIEHLKTRKQFGHPLGSFQALQHRVVNCFVELETNRSLLHRTCLAWDGESFVPAMAAAAKSRSARVTAEVMRTGLQFHGAIGYTDEYDLGILFKRSLVLAARYGNEISQAERYVRLTEEEERP